MGQRFHEVRRSSLGWLAAGSLTQGTFRRMLDKSGLATSDLGSSVWKKSSCRVADEKQDVEYDTQGQITDNQDAIGT